MDLRPLVSGPCGFPTQLFMVSWRQRAGPHASDELFVMNCLSILCGMTANPFEEEDAEVKAAELDLQQAIAAK